MKPKYTFALFLFLGLIMSSTLAAQDYIIGSDDAISVTFWQQPDLNTAVAVKQDGKIALPVIGEITAAGLTPSQLSGKIVERMSFYNKNISQATVVVTGYNSRKVFVQGQVASPGKYGFERIPNLWEVIREAGGPTELADLSNVTIIRAGEQEGKVEKVNLDSYLKKGDLSKIPQLGPGDAINVPRSAIGTGGEPSVPAQFQGRDIYYIYGQIGKPGAYPLNEPIDLLDAITLAGGTAPTANMKKVKVIAKGERYSQVISIDMEKYINQGSTPRYLIKPEDTVVIPIKESSGFGKVWSITKDLIPLTGAITSVYLLVDRLKGD